VLLTRATHRMHLGMLPYAELFHALYISTLLLSWSMWLPWRIELTWCLTVHLVLTIFTLVSPLSSLQSSVHSYRMSNNPGPICASAHMTCSDGVVPHVIPPLLPSNLHLEHPHLPLNPQHHISVNPLCPQVLASNCFTSQLTPYGIVKMNSKTQISLHK